nr:MAG TPA: hypothetical protein [Caudoviricetes sp.]
MALDHRRFTAFNNFFLTSQVSFVILTIEFQTSIKPADITAPER